MRAPDQDLPVRRIALPGAPARAITMVLRSTSISFTARYIGVVQVFGGLGAAFPPDGHHGTSGAGPRPAGYQATRDAELRRNGETARGRGYRDGFAAATRLCHRTCLIVRKKLFSMRAIAPVVEAEEAPSRYLAKITKSATITAQSEP